ncbi:MAG: hypothetical protein JO257_04630 [Deltaproteobacteria bacterium]|nr:hypothetical protein [Deltaproteobacteria bacterium]
MMMHKNDANSEAGNPPSKEIIEKMGAFIGGYIKSGRLLDGAGLLGSKHRTRISCRDGQCTVKHGPYRGEDSELPAAMLALEVTTREQAIGWAERYAKILGDCELEVGKVTEPWDLGVMPEPQNAPLHFLLIEKGERQHTPAQKAAISRLKTEMTKAGVLQRSHELAPSTQAKRLYFTNNKLRVVDGPFTESKELIGGFTVMELPSFDAAIEIAIPYTEILGGTIEIDLRVLV